MLPSTGLAPSIVSVLEKHALIFSTIYGEGETGALLPHQTSGFPQPNGRITIP